MNYLSTKPALFKKLHNIKLSHSVFRVTTFFQFDSTKSTLNILLEYAHDLDKNLKTHAKLVTNNNYDHKSYDARQWIISYSALLKWCSDELSDCKLQIAQLTSQVNNILPPSINQNIIVQKEE